MEYRIDTTTTQGSGIGIVIVPERLDAANCGDLQQRYQEWARNTPDIVFDCSRLTFIDSSGLGAIVACLRQAINRQGDLKLARLGLRAMMLFELTKAKKLFSIYPDVESAVTSFSLK